ncbi:MAG: AI-2E family transporter [Patescibacteria group bacterium]
MDKKVFEISWASLWRVLFIIAFAIALYLIKDVLLVLFMALVISSALDAPISYLESKKIPRILATIFVFLASLSILALLLYTIVPVAIFEMKNLFEKFEELEIPAVGAFITPKLTEGIKTNLGNLTDMLFSGGASFVEVIAGIFGGIAFVGAVFVLSFYLAASREGVERFLRAVLPVDSEELAVKVYLSAKQKLGLWLKGQLILSFTVGILAFLGLWILGVKYSLTLGILAAIFEMVPFVGPIFTGATAFLLGVSESLALGIMVIVLFVIIQQIENHLLIPIVMRKTVGLHPVVAVIALLAGAQIAGFVGIILAVPTAVVIQEIIESRAARKNQVGRFNFE